MSSLFSRRTRLALAWFCFLVHVLSLASMLLVLQHGLLLGDTGSRQAFIAGNASAWRVGWAVWLPASLSLLLLFLAWADVLPFKGWGLAAALVCLAGATIDWLNEIMLIGLVPELAVRAVADTLARDLFATWENYYRIASLGLANGLYTLGGFILSALSFKMGHFPRWLAWLGGFAWSASAGLSVAALLGNLPTIFLVSAATFSLFMPWLLLLGYGWLQKADAAVFPPARVSFVNTLRAMTPKHPVPMTATFRNCFMVNFAVKPEVVRPLVPEPFDLDLHAGHAFLSVVFIEMERMRPAFLPQPFGITCRQVVYRIDVRYRGEHGVYFIRSDVDNRLMAFAGDWLTFFRFHFSNVNVERGEKTLRFDLQSAPGQRADIHACYQLDTAGQNLPAASSFETLSAAKEFLVQRFTAFSYDALTDTISTVRIRRGEWNIQVVSDSLAAYELMQDSEYFPPGAARLDSVFYVKNLPYYWQTLRVEPRASLI